MKQVDTRADRYADSEWHSGWIESQTKPWKKEPARSYFGAALLVLWVVAVVVLTFIWEHFA